MTTANLKKEIEAFREAIQATPAGARRVYLEALGRRIEAQMAEAQLSANAKFPEALPERGVTTKRWFLASPV